MSPRQRIASAAYAIMAEKAADSDTIDRYHAGNEANKIPILGPNAALAIAQGGTGNTTGWEFKMGTATWTSSRSGGTTTVTGIGFQPRLVIFSGGSYSEGGIMNGSDIGFDDGTNRMCRYGRNSNTQYQCSIDINHSIHFEEGLPLAGYISSFKSNGFTIIWSSNEYNDGTPVRIIYLAFK